MLGHSLPSPACCCGCSPPAAGGASPPLRSCLLLPPLPPLTSRGSRLGGSRMLVFHLSLATMPSYLPGGCPRVRRMCFVRRGRRFIIKAACGCEWVWAGRKRSMEDRRKSAPVFVQRHQVDHRQRAMRRAAPHNCTPGQAHGVPPVEAHPVHVGEWADWGRESGAWVGWRGWVVLKESLPCACALLRDG